MPSEHRHDHSAQRFNKAFVIGIGLNLGVVALEVIYGLQSNSISLLSDAGHNATDVLGLVLAGGAMLLARKTPTSRRTYGMRRSSILAAAVNAVFLLVVIGALSWESVLRLQNPEPVADMTIVVVAAIGMALNATTAFLFRDSGHDMNLRTAYQHMASDAMIAFGVVVTGIAIHFSGWLWLDPAIGLAIGIGIAFSTWKLLVESFNLALDAVPSGIRQPEVLGYLSALPDICGVHDLHIWAMSTTETALTAHLVTRKEGLDNDLLTRITHELQDQFGISHPTIQIEFETPEHACTLSDPAHV